MSAYSQ